MPNAALLDVTASDDGNDAGPLTDDEGLVLANRSFVYSLLARAFAEEPDDASVEIFCAGHTEDELLLIEDGHSAPIAQAYDRAARRLWPSASAEASGGVRSVPREHRDGTAQSIAAEYASLFVGPEAPRSRPWESMHIVGKAAPSQPEVLEVRRAYREAGFLPASYPRVADDFIGIEMDFMAKLAEAAACAHEEGECEACMDALRRSRDFIELHLGCWVGSLARAIAEGCPEGFYEPLSAIASEFVERDRELLRYLVSGEGASDDTEREE